MFADIPSQGYLGLRGAPPMTLLGGLPDVVTAFVVSWLILFVLTVLESDADGEIEVEATADGQGIAVFQTSTKAELRSLIALAAPFDIVSETQYVGSYVMAREARIVAQRIFLVGRCG